MLAASLCTIAQEQDERTDTTTIREVSSDSYIHTTATSIDEVTVYGKRTIQDHRSTAPVYTITQSSLDQLGVTDISSALSRLPGITLRDYGGAGGLKTVSVRGFGAKHTGVVYDGVALSNNQSGSIDVARYSMDNVSDLSLVIGNDDNIFQPARNAASAAALHINTLKLPTDDLGMHLTGQLRTGSWGYVNPHIRLDKNFSKRFGMALVADFLHANNDYPYTIDNVGHKEYARRKNSRMNSGNADLSIVYRPSQDNTISVKGYYYNNGRQLPGMAHYYVNDSKQTMHDENAFGQLNWTSTLNKKLQLSFVAKFNYAMTDFKDPAYPGGVKDHQYWQRETYTSASLLYTLNKHLALDYSADYIYNNLTGGDVSVYRSPQRHTVLQTIAAKYTIQRLTIVGRLLHSIYRNKAITGESAKSIDHLSPSISFNYKLLPNEELYLRMGYKDIFRAPSFSESYYEHFGSTDLNPERTNQFNLGATWAHPYGYGSNFSLTTDAYINKVKDKIISIPYDMFKWTNVNLGSVHSHGFDLTAQVNQRVAQRHRLLLAVNYTLQKVRDRTGDKSSKYYDYQVAYTPEYSGGASLAWENPWLNISANTVMVASRWPNNEHYQGTMLPGYSTIGLTAYRNINIRNFDLHLRFDLKNLLNTQYEIVGNYPMPGRSWMATIRIKY